MGWPMFDGQPGRPAQWIILAFILCTLAKHSNAEVKELTGKVQAKIFKCFTVAWAISDISQNAKQTF